MSTNLGWPSEPEPGPEHRRLGWLARMLGVSRETPEALDAATPEGQSADPAALQAVSRAAVDTSSGDAQARALSDTSQAPTLPDAGRDGEAGLQTGAEAVPEPDGEADVEPGDQPRGETDRQVDAVDPIDERRTADAAAPSVEADGQGADDARSDVGHSEPVDARTVTSSDAGDHERATVDSALRGPAPATRESDQNGDSVDLAPVDNAVDGAAPHRPIEQEIVVVGAGENLVDDLRVPTQFENDHAEREALAAALPTPGTDTPLARELADNARRRIQLTGRQFPKPVSPRVLTVANQKGGVGKTTTTVNVAAALAQSGLTVLVIDLDPQGNASTALGIDHHAEVPSIYDVLVDGTPLLDVVQPCTTIEKLFCAPATIDLAGAEIELVSLVARESRLQKAIAAATADGHEFDYILIDCPPSLGLLTVNAMVAASEVFIPIQCEYYALEGLSQLLKNIDLVKRHLNPTLHVSTILLTMYDGRTRLSAQVADEVREHFPEEVLRTTVPRSVRVSEAPSFGETVMTYDPASSGALAYLEAAGEMADRGAAGRI